MRVPKHRRQEEIKKIVFLYGPISQTDIKEKISKIFSSYTDTNIKRNAETDLKLLEKDGLIEKWAMDKSGLVIGKVTQTEEKTFFLDVEGKKRRYNPKTFGRYVYQNPSKGSLKIEGEAKLKTQGFEFLCSEKIKQSVSIKSGKKLDDVYRRAFYLKTLNSGLLHLEFNFDEKFWSTGQKHFELYLGRLHDNGSVTKAKKLIEKNENCIVLLVPKGEDNISRFQGGDKGQMKINFYPQETVIQHLGGKLDTSVTQLGLHQFDSIISQMTFFADSTATKAHIDLKNNQFFNLKKKEHKECGYYCQFSVGKWMAWIG